MKALSLVLHVNGGRACDEFKKCGLIQQATDLFQLDQDIIAKFKEGRFVEAARAANAASKIAESCPLLNYYTSYVEREYCLALKAFGEDDPRAVRSLLLIAESRMDLAANGGDPGGHQELIKIIEHAISIAERAGLDNVVRGSAYYEYGRALRFIASSEIPFDTRVVDSYRKAIELYGTDTKTIKNALKARTSLGFYFKETGFHDEAVNELEKSTTLARACGDQNAEYLALFHLHEGEVGRVALEIRKRWLELSRNIFGPESTQARSAHYLFAYACVANLQDDEGLKNFNEAERLASGFANYEVQGMVKMAAALRRIGRNDEADLYSARAGVLQGADVGR
jgi:tetratricopeptide (TPR) repeat protein